MKNFLLEKVEYKIETTNFGIWRRFLYPNGACFAEFKSHAIFFRLPLLHYTRGKCPETGKRVVAKGVVAVGRLAMGILAIGQAAIGLMFGLGQIATGEIAIGQLAYGNYVLAQVGYGDYVWSMKRADPEAVKFFKSLLARFIS
jgi:hypothetical protein